MVMAKWQIKTRRKIILWCGDVAYAVGLLVTDGCLSSDGRHIDLTSKDIEQLENFKKCLGLHAPISYKVSGYTGKKITRVQFSDVVLYRFLLDIGLTPAKTKSLGKINIPDAFFFDFLRGHHDGDGSFYSYWDPRWKSSFMFYTTFTSSSKEHLIWLQRKIKKLSNVEGTINGAKNRSCYQLRYAKKDSLKILHRMYHKGNIKFLSRKHLKIKQALSIIGESL